MLTAHIVHDEMNRKLQSFRSDWFEKGEGLHILCMHSDNFMNNKCVNAFYICGHFAFCQMIMSEGMYVLLSLKALKRQFTVFRLFNKFK